MKVAFIGGGNMAGALIGGMLRSGVAASDIDVLEIDSTRRAELSGLHGVTVHAQPADWLRASQIIVLAVKPQQMAEAASAIKGHLDRPLSISIAAGITSSAISGWLAADAIVRAMPNMPALIGAGITGAFASQAVSAEQRSAAHMILSAVGAVIWLDSETMLDDVTAISGSGPAYVFYFIEAMQAAARDLGFDEAQARALTMQTFVGAAQLASQSSESIAVLREKVTSKGGTTAAALASFDRDKVDQAIARAIQAAAARARELGR
ncbi:MAG: pyrroline-5-carboxylate reductase [Pseudomonadota bacterium]|nr:pyrroline-5-carboxylate reductase [Pseudomonadota bacterium]